MSSIETILPVHPLAGLAAGIHTPAGLAARIEAALSEVGVAASSISITPGPSYPAVGVWGSPDFSTGDALHLATAIGVTNPTATTLDIAADGACPARSFAFVEGRTSDGIRVSIYADHQPRTA